ncbi:MAG TPA: hypothetical protein VEY70_11485 [Metabacillus sp.]|nr:hypothetical protein [Metabacillus sp.]
MRTKKSFINIINNLLFNITNIFLNFFSRSLFLKYFNVEYLGLVTLVTNIIGVLSIAELGISTAISYSLYSHINQGNKKKINELLKLIKIAYVLIGVFILVIGILIMPFLTDIFVSELKIKWIYITYILFLTTTVFSYFLTYKQILIIADQNSYIITRTIGVIRILKTVLQIIILIYTQNFMLWVIVESFSNLIAFILINLEINNKYKWLNLKINKTFKQILRENKTVLKNIRHIVVHKLSGTVTTQTDSIIIGLVSSAKNIALYSNYLLIVNGLTTIISQIFNGFTASIGNLISEGNNKKSYSIFLQLYYLEFYIGVIATYTLYKSVNSFITVWIGEEYTFPQILVLIISMNFFIQITRRTVDYFKDGYGIFYDIFAPLTQVILNLFFSFYLGNIYGILGVYLGTLISSIPIIVFWRPYILFKHGFKMHFLKYVISITRLILMSTFSLTCSEFILSFISIEVTGIGSLLIYLFFVLVISSTILCLFLIPISHFRIILGVVTKFVLINNLKKLKRS